ncbi:hypothetical protein [Sporisorium scitamineum]|uniref:Uncharacterized protein n=1 Tax=Sporisorium scitamineum TaxID=49012 RepID=A0A0F7RZT8_9BASI|nr:hypothetical protein [Sporisorium scitamineum]
MARSWIPTPIDLRIPFPVPVNGSLTVASAGSLA